MSKRAIGIFYGVGVFGYLMGIFIFLASAPVLHLSYARRGIALLLVIALVGAIPSMIAWIGTLINLARAQAWGWFALTFFFSGIMVLIYLIAGPQPLQKGQAPQAQQWVVSPPLSYPAGFPSQPPQAYQPPQPVSALEILQQRYARGEIDTATFDEMRARLEASDRPHY